MKIARVVLQCVEQFSKLFIELIPVLNVAGPSPFRTSSRSTKSRTTATTATTSPSKAADPEEVVVIKDIVEVGRNIKLGHFKSVSQSTTNYLNLQLKMVSKSNEISA